MKPIAMPFVKKVTPLRNDEIQLWWLNYQRAQGRAPLRRILATYLATDDPSTVDLTETEWGRPYLRDPHSRLQFNWSHSGRHALLAVACGIVPGVDLEQQRDHRHALAIAKRYFCAAEIAMLAALSPPQRSRMFLSLWTAREAVLKATGRGLASGLNQLRVSPSITQPKLLHLEGDDACAWQLHALNVHPDYVASLAWRGAPRRVRQPASGRPACTL